MILKVSSYGLIFVLAVSLFAYFMVFLSKEVHAYRYSVIYDEATEAYLLTDADGAAYSGSDAESYDRFFRDFFLPEINILHVILLISLVLLYVRNKKYRKLLCTTRARLKKQDLKLNDRIDKISEDIRMQKKKLDNIATESD